LTLERTLSGVVNQACRANHLDTAPGQDTLVAYVRRAKSDSRYPQRGENATDI
jgi:hypothetical protein